mgnify:CR=1 FL=1
MLIKALYLIFIFLVVRLVFSSLKKYHIMVDENKKFKQQKKKSKKDEFINAEFKVVNDDED